MLSRTADHCFWMARYTERAENTARLLDVNVQTALMPQSQALADESWMAMLDISELIPLFEQLYGKDLSGAALRDAVLAFMVRDDRNGSSIVSCLRSARENARAVRGTLTTEVWETQNTTWLELQKQLAHLMPDTMSPFFEWVKFRSHLSRGVTSGTMLRDEAYYFIRQGTFLERADNTARLLDVKFAKHSATDEAAVSEESQQQFYYWAALLRSVSSFEIYRKVYRDVITPQRVAELLMLRADMPRSLLACMDDVVLTLRHVRNNQSAETERLAGQLRAQLQYGAIDEVLKEGLHAYLTDFLNRINQIGNRISQDFLVPITH